VIKDTVVENHQSLFDIGYSAYPDSINHVDRAPTKLVQSERSVDFPFFRSPSLLHS